MNYLKKVFFITNVKKSKLFFMILLFFFSSFLDFLGIGLIGPFILVINDPNLLKNSPIWQHVPSFFHEDRVLIASISIFLLISFYFRAVIVSILQKIIFGFGFKKYTEITNRLLKIYQELPYILHIERSSSEFIYNLTQAVYLFVLYSLIPILQIIAGIAVFIFIFGLILFKDVYATIGLAVSIGGVMLVYDALFKRKLLRCGEDVNERQTKIIQAIQHAIKGQKEISLLSKKEFFREKVCEHSLIYGKALATAYPLQAIPRYLIESSLVTFMVVFAVISIFFGGEFSTVMSTLTVFGVAGIRLMPTFNQVSFYMSQVRQSYPYVDQLYSDLSRYKDKAVLKEEEVLNNPFNSFEKISAKGVSFHYENNKKKQVLKDISLDIERGQVIGIMGASGSGKTTLVDLLLGLIEPTEGNIFIDQTPMNEHLSQWQKKAAYIPQKIFLIEDTVEANIALGVPENKINQTTLLEAIKLSQLEEVIENLPNKGKTFIGEEGVKLSGGQRQRIGIARAFYFKREFLVMDEATASLDKEIEEEVCKEIQNLKRKKTIVIIAHRSKALEFCDVVYEVKKGELIKRSSLVGAV